ncbi:MAG: PrgI family protein [Patescibacteria group bacterium]|jgi:hypothetical protein|nr:PrgI family protein [Patescibacteria group bacterium]
MAEYKVIQDVEAEDKIIGSLSLKQLIFAAIAVAIAFLGFRIFMLVGNIFIFIPFLPFIIVFGLLAAPLGRQQSTELWLAAQVHFYTKPRKRIWDQSDIKQLVHITVPRKIEKQYTDGLNQGQVKSRISALATAMDSRGQAILHPMQISDYTNGNYGRIIESKVNKSRVDLDIKPGDDILDANNSTSQNFSKLLQESDKNHKQKIIEDLKKPKPANPAKDQDNTVWFTQTTDQIIDTPKDISIANYAGFAPEPQAKIVSLPANKAAEETEEDKAILKNNRALSTEKFRNPHHKVVPTPEQIAAQQEQDKLDQEIQNKAKQARQKRLQDNKPKTGLTKTDTIELAYDNNLSVSSVQHLADRKAAKQKSPSEVVVKLH